MRASESYNMRNNPHFTLTSDEIKKQCELIWKSWGIESAHHITGWELHNGALVPGKGRPFEFPPGHKEYENENR